MLDWSLSECEITVEAYFECLAKKLSGEPYNRAKTCRDIAEIIHRSAGAAAVAANVQRLLTYVVLDPLAKRNSVFEIVPKTPIPVTDTKSLVVAPPAVPPNNTDSDEEKSRVARKIDFAKREAKNRNLGRSGEKWVLSFEKKRLQEAGKSDLAERVDWVSDRVGDGLGYDIVSFEVNGSELFIEVKTTNAGATTPFFISPNELAESERKRDAFKLYRVFDFSSEPHVYILSGPLEPKLALKPQAFTAVPNGN